MKADLSKDILALPDGPEKDKEVMSTMLLYERLLNQCIAIKDTQKEIIASKDETIRLLREQIEIYKEGISKLKSIMGIKEEA